MEILTSELIHKELMKRATTYASIKWVKVDDVIKWLNTNRIDVDLDFKDMFDNNGKYIFYQVLYDKLSQSREVK